MQTYIFRQTNSSYHPLLNVALFHAHSRSHAQLRAALLSYVVLGCRDVPDLSNIRVDDGSAPEAAFFPESFILPIEKCLFTLFEDCSVLDA
jgi:hypothetical protein